MEINNLTHNATGYLSRFLVPILKPTGNKNKIYNFIFYIFIYTNINT